MNDLDKIDHLTKRCSELFASMKRLERDSVKNKKRADQLQKDKDTSRNEVTKQTTLKEKLEKLCRELQRENNKLKVDHRTLQDTHSKLKKDTDKRLEEVLKTLEGYQEEKDNPRKQVMNTKVEDLYVVPTTPELAWYGKGVVTDGTLRYRFKNRFKSLIDQYDLRDLHFHSHMRNKEIEVQWNMARYEEQKKVAETETVRSRQLNSQVQTFSKTETELRNQLNVYVDKFKQASTASPLHQALGLTCASHEKVEDTLNNSNDLFLTFRKEMEDMSKKTKKLEKENDVLKRKVEARNSNIIKMADEQQKKEKDLKDTQKKNEKLTSIINQMQQQGRGIPQGMQGTVESGYGDGDGGQAGELEDGEEESDYNDEYEEGDDEESEEGEFDDDTEEEVHEPAVRNTASRTAPYGPDPPPAPTTKISPAVAALTTNGHR
jgi:chromosome segregation ATPase